MVGILVHGNNHFILRGPKPGRAEGLALARHFSIVRIGEPAAVRFEQWEIRHKEFRENLAWALVLPGDCDTSPGVAALLGELEARGIPIERYSDPRG